MAEETKPKLKPEKSIISLELYGRRVKICEAAFFGRKNPVFRFMSEEVPEEGGDISSSLTDLFRARSLTTKRVFLNIPRHLVMARIYHLPSVNDEEIKNMVRMEAVKHMPYRDEAIITGYRIIEKFKNGYSDVFLTIVQAETINRLVDILRNAALSVEKIALGSESLFAWRSAIMRMGRMDSRFRGNGNIALINIDSTYVNMDIVEKSNLVFARAFSYDPDEPDAMRKIAEEIGKSVTIYQKERNLRIEKMFVSGAGQRLKAIEPILKENAYAPSELIAQTEGIEVAESAETALQESSFVELIGLSLRGEEAKIDLLPEKMREDKDFLVFKKAVTRTLVLLGSVAIVLLGVIGQKIFDKSRLLGLLNAEIRAIEPVVAEAKRMREDLKIIKNEIQKKNLAIDILSEIYNITPPGITFDLLDYESDEVLLMRGSAPSLDGIIRFISILENSQYFENVKLKYTTKRMRKQKELTDFEIVCLPSKGK